MSVVLREVVLDRLGGGIVWVLVRCISAGKMLAKVLSIGGPISSDPHNPPDPLLVVLGLVAFVLVTLGFDILKGELRRDR